MDERIPFELEGQTKYERLKEVTDKLEAGISELFNSESYAEYLRAMSKFHSYSFNNTMLIFMQMPDASLIAGFNKWRDDFNRFPRKGVKSIKIFAPAPYKEKREALKFDPNGNPVLDADGQQIKELKEYTVSNYKVVSVYDVSQTYGDPVPDYSVDQLTGSVENYQDFFNALEKASPVPIGFEELSGGTLGRYSHADKRISLLQGMSELQTLKTLIHEIAHARLHDIDLNAPPDQQQERPDRRTREVQAESVAYTVCQHYGLDTSEYSFGYVAGWSSGKEMKELKASLETIRATAAGMIDTVDKHFCELRKEQTMATEIDGQTVEAQTLPQPLGGQLARAYATDYFNYMAARNEANGLPRFGTDESDVVIADITKQMIERDIADIRDTLQHSLSAYGETWIENAGITVTADTLLNRLEAFAPAERSPTLEAATQGLQQEVKATLQWFIDEDMNNHGTLQPLTLEMIAKQGYVSRDGKLEEIEPTPELPDPSINADEMTAYGYSWDGMFPLRKERALELYEQGHNIYRLYEDGAEGLADERAGIEDFDGIFGIERVEWEAVTKYATEQAKETALIEEPGDRYGIYQFEPDATPERYAFAPFHEAINVMHRDHYKLAYIAPLTADDTPESLYSRHNMEDRPAAASMRSMSMSDVLLLKRDGKLTALYADRFGFQPIEGFMERDTVRPVFDLERTAARLQAVSDRLNNLDRDTLTVQTGADAYRHAAAQFKEIAAAIPDTQEQLKEIVVNASNSMDLSMLISWTGIINQAVEKIRETEQTAPQRETPEDAPDEPQTAVTYYNINEGAARRAKEAISFSDYRQGSATAEYRQSIDEAVKIADSQKARVDPMYHEKIDGLLNTYSRKLAENMNKGFSITSRVPSIMIAGGSNFPVRAKEKQNAASRNNIEEWREIQGLLDRIRSTGMGGISADDPDAIKKLESKLSKLEQSQETMKAANAYYRKNKTLDGCPNLTAETIAELKASMSRSWRGENAKPFESYSLTNNNAEIHRTRERIESLKRHSTAVFASWQFDGGKVEANPKDNRLQIFFDTKPDEAIRAELKSNGFRWAHNAGAWQRQLNANAYYASDRITSIQPITGEKPTDLQRQIMREAKAESHIETAEMSTEQNYNMIDGIPNNSPTAGEQETIRLRQVSTWDGYYRTYYQNEATENYLVVVDFRGKRTWHTTDSPSGEPDMPLKDGLLLDIVNADGVVSRERITRIEHEAIGEFIPPTVAELDAKVQAGETISLLDLANALKNEPLAPEKKPSLLGELAKNKAAVAQNREATTKDAPTHKPDLEVD